MMKISRKIGYSAVALFILCSACGKDFLDRKPRDLVLEEPAYGSQSGLEALTAQLYSDVLWEDFSYEVAEQSGYPATVTDEAVRSYTWSSGLINGTVIGNWFGSWDYSKIRRVNDFIAKVSLATVSSELRSRFEAEGRFIRAFHYFQLVKRYGGVPLVTQVKQYAAGDNVAGLFVPRNTEKEVFDFIAEELDKAIEVLPARYPTADFNRVTKYGAYALKSRAMLYAASIAEYGQVQLNGLVGIPSGEASRYWQAAYDASSAIINSGQYKLLDSGTDKVTNFQDIFLTANNGEAIFSKIYKLPEVGHSYDFFNAPQSFRVDYGCAINPTLDFVEAFEYTDGSVGTLRVKDAAGDFIAYANPLDLFKDKDPRLLASIMVPFSPWQGSILEIRRGVMVNGVKRTVENLTTGYPRDDANFKLVGKDGPLTTADPTKTGFYVKKSMNPNKRVNSGESDAPYHIFRLGEILLNYAEAAVELGKNDDALSAINQIRSRAGIKTMAEVTVASVRKERRVELAFENHRFWDLKRWRVATEVLNNTQFHALYPWLVWEEGKTPEQMKYVFEVVNAPKNPRTFPEKLYYEPLPQGNPTYIQNPLY